MLCVRLRLTMTPPGSHSQVTLTMISMVPPLGSMAFSAFWRSRIIVDDGTVAKYLSSDRVNARAPRVV